MSSKNDDLLIYEYVSHASREAIWQFMIDHAKKSGDGQYAIYFCTPSQKNFWRRVEARYTSTYKRNNKAQVESMIEKEKSNINNMLRHNFRMKEVYNHFIAGNMKWYDRIMYKLYKVLYRYFVKVYYKKHLRYNNSKFRKSNI